MAAASVRHHARPERACGMELLQRCFSRAAVPLPPMQVTQACGPGQRQQPPPQTLWQLGQYRQGGLGSLLVCRLERCRPRLCSALSAPPISCRRAPAAHPRWRNCRHEAVSDAPPAAAAGHKLRRHPRQQRRPSARARLYNARAGAGASASAAGHQVRACKTYWCSVGGLQIFCNPHPLRCRRRLCWRCRRRRHHQRCPARQWQRLRGRRRQHQISTDSRARPAAVAPSRRRRNSPQGDSAAA